MYSLVKFLSLWIYPLGTSVLLLTAALVLLTLRRHRLAVGLLAGGLAWLWFWSMPVVADRAVAWLEHDWSYRPVDACTAADAIVVMGGAFSSGLGEWPYPDAGGNIDRYWHAARLLHAGCAPWVILSGGRNPARPDSLSEAQSGALFLIDLGVPKSALLLDNEARTTADNASNIARMLVERGLEEVLLVTSAVHMRRSLAAMQAAGVSAIPVPTDFSVTRQPAWSIRRLLPSAGALSRSTAAIHEIVGLWVYRVTGRAAE